MEALTIDENGIKAASYSEIREALQKDYKAVFGSSMNVDPSSPDGMLIDIFAYAYNALAQNLQTVATNLNVATASGVFLDYLAEIAVGGRNTGESDEDLIKRIRSADRSGYATEPGMLSYLQKKIGASVGLVVNDDAEEKNGLKGHSFAVYVPETSSLTNDQIASIIWTCKPAGIKSQGDLTGSVNTSAGKQTVAFSRVSAQPFWVKIEITEYAEENLPAQYEETITKAVLDWAKDEYTPGKDIIRQRFFTPVFQVPGILNASIAVKLNATDAWSTANSLSVPGSKYAVLTSDRVVVKKAE